MGAYIDGGAHDWDIGDDEVDEDIKGNILIIASFIFIWFYDLYYLNKLEQRKSFVS